MPQTKLRQVAFYDFAAEAQRVLDAEAEEAAAAERVAEAAEAAAKAADERARLEAAALDARMKEQAEFGLLSSGGGGASGARRESIKTGNMRDFL